MKSLKRVLLDRVWKRQALIGVLIALFVLYCTLMTINYQTERTIFEDRLQSRIETETDRISNINIALQAVTNRYDRAKEKVQSAGISIPELESIGILIDLTEEAISEQNPDLAEKRIEDMNEILAEILPKIDTSYKTNTISVLTYSGFISGEVSRDLEAINKDGTPLSRISFSIDGHTGTTENEKVLAGCNIYPIGVSFKTTTYLIMYYDPLDIPDGWFENDLILMQSSNNGNDQENLFGKVDTSLHNITATITDLGTFWILAVKPSLPILAPSFPWVSMLIAFLVLCTLIWVILKYKQKTRPRKSAKGLTSLT